MAAIWADADGVSHVTADLPEEWSAWGMRLGASPADPYVVGAPGGTLLYGAMPDGASDVEWPTSEVRHRVVAGGLYLALVQELGAKAAADESASDEDGGTYGVITDDDLPHVLFRAANGEIVRRPLGEEELKRVPVTDADTPCGVCGECSWERVEVRAEPEKTFTRWALLVCGTCGWHSGGRSSAGRNRPGVVDPHDEQDEQPAGLSDNPEPWEVVEAAAFPVFGPDRGSGGRITLGSYGWQGGSIEQVTILRESHAGGRRSSLAVQSSSGGETFISPPNRRVVDELESMLCDDALDPDDRELSAEARELRIRERTKSLAAQAERAEVGEVRIGVDDREVPFVVARDPSGVWTALSTDRSVHVSLEGRGLEPGDVQLVKLTDPRAYFAPRSRRTPA